MPQEPVRLPASVTFASAPQVLADASRALAGRACEVDLGGCVEFDSSLIGVLLELSRQASAAGKVPCRFLAPSANLRKLALLYGVDELLFVHRD